MPQLDLISFLTQYSWTLITIFILFSFLVSSILPKIQQQLAIRNFSTDIMAQKIETPVNKNNLFKQLFNQ